MRPSGSATFATLLTILLVAVAASPVAKSPASRLLADEPWSPAPWSELAAGPKRDVRRSADSLAYEAARNDTAFAARRWRYLSDSAEVVALVLAAPTPARRPAIVYLRGSYTQQGQLDGFLPLLHRLARAGYFVVAPQYRGSEGGTGRDEMGGEDVEDVLAVVRLLAMRPEVDPRAIYLYGESRGGMMTFQAIRDGAPVRAAATVGAFTDLDSLFAADERSASLAPRIWPDYDTRRNEIALRRSAARWAERIRVPLLLLHGADDRGVPPRQSEQLAAALARAKAPHELRIVPGGSHTLGERSGARDSMVVRWFRSHAP